MRTRRLSPALAALAAALGVTLTVLSHAEPPPRAPFTDELLSRLEGRWNLVRQIRGKEVRNTVEARWVLAHQFLEMHMKDVNEPPAYEAIVLIGFDDDAHHYVAHWTDTWGAKFAALGKGTRTGDAIEFRFDYPDGPFFNTFTWNAERKTWTFRGENQDADGKRNLFLLDTLERAP